MCWKQFQNGKDNKTKNCELTEHHTSGAAHCRIEIFKTILEESMSI
jgi:hypothetical protein